MEQKIVDFAIQYSVLLFALSFHESAHAWSALKFGDPTARDLGRISLNPLRHIDPIGTVLLPVLGFLAAGHFMFGWAKPTPVNLGRTANPRRANLFVSAAGPLSNLVLCTVGILVLAVIQRLTLGPRANASVIEPVWAIALSFTLVNFILGVFNLFPIPPLDGSHVLASLAGGRVAQVLEQANPMLGFGLILILSYTGILSRMLAPFYGAFQSLLRVVLT